DVGRSAAFFAEAMGWLPVARSGDLDRSAAWPTILPNPLLHSQAAWMRAWLCPVLIRAEWFLATAYAQNPGHAIGVRLEGEWGKPRRVLPRPGKRIPPLSLEEGVRLPRS